MRLRGLAKGAPSGTAPTDAARMTTSHSHRAAAPLRGCTPRAAVWKSEPPALWT